MSCVDLLVTSLYQRGCLSERVNLPAKRTVCATQKVNTNAFDIFCQLGEKL